MLELYHHGSSVCAARVRLSLEEKELPWESHYVDILKGEQFSDEYRTINPKALVPTLVHNGFVVPEATVICEYLEDICPEQPLRPADPGERSRAMLWAKAVDEELHPACAELTFAASHRYTLFKLGPEKVKAFLDSTPGNSLTHNWHNRKKQIVREGFKAPDIADKVKLYGSYMHRMETALQEDLWLTGKRFTLADTAMLPYVMRLEMMSMHGIWASGRLPNVARWLQACKQRSSFRPALLDWLPDDLRKDLHAHGTISWPDVAGILDIPV
ncbi:MAG: glutathione S-transferase family protein [Pseudohongiellaceae bacterium]